MTEREKIMRHNLGVRTAGAAVALALGWVASAAADDDKTRRVEGLSFESVLVMDNIRVEISQDEEHVLRYRTDVEEFDREPFYIARGNTLVLRKSRRGDVRFRVSMPSLERVTVRGSGSAYVKPFSLPDSSTGTAEFILDGSGDLRLYGFEGPEVELSVKGAGDLKAVNVEAGDIIAVVSGSGELYLREVKADRGMFTVTGSGDLEVTERGYVREIEVDVVGSGDAELDVVDCRDADVNVVGSGNVSLGRVERSLTATILGSGDIRYRGDPKIERTIFG
ncbi:MAG: DUF2807 domain-containing protein, partial [Pseudomonadota bacterium]